MRGKGSPWRPVPSYGPLPSKLHHARFIACLQVSLACMPACLVGCEDDEAVVEWLVRVHAVCIIPGSSCGAPGYVRVAFGNLQPGACREAARRLRAGLEQLRAEGAQAVRQVPLASALHT